MPLVHWPECTNAPCTCGERGDLLFSDIWTDPIVMCTECGHLTRDAKPVVQLVNGLVLYVCDGCWIQLDYPTFMRA